MPSVPLMIPVWLTVSVRLRVTVRLTVPVRLGLVLHVGLVTGRSRPIRVAEPGVTGGCVFGYNQIKLQRQLV